LSRTGSVLTKALGAKQHITESVVQRWDCIDDQAGYLYRSGAEFDVEFGQGYFGCFRPGIRQEVQSDIHGLRRF
jgi:hypothetical protein